jgi:bifunctional non-homologous end joining protein LigD
LLSDRSRVSRFQLLQKGKVEPSYAVFDCLYLNGNDMRRQSLWVRRAALENVVPKQGQIFLSNRLAEDGLEAYRLAKKRGYEGIVAKELMSPYIEHRSNKWLKVKVGTGFDKETLGMLARSLRPLIRKRLSVANPPRGKDITYVAPRLVAQIAFAEWTADHKLRQPVFLGLRDDKNPKEVALPEDASRVQEP